MADLCKTCPVSGITSANACTHMNLRATVSRPLAALFQRQVQVSAYCQTTSRAQMATFLARALGGSN